MCAVGTSTHHVGVGGRGSMARVWHAAICACVVVLDMMAVALAVVEVFEYSIGVWRCSRFILEGLWGKLLLLRHC